MQLINKRKEVITNEYFTLELEKNQLITILTAINLTNVSERKMEVVDYGVEDFRDKGEELCDSLEKLLHLDGTPVPKMPESPNNTMVTSSVF